jgi:isopentenyl diphosphate isomerase/L-lactate dehydrogenase-like FMN-dependent dehydrogenase
MPQSEEVKEQATEQLAKVSNRLDCLEKELENHLCSLGVATIDELDEDAKAEIDKLRPTDWLCGLR